MRIPSAAIMATTTRMTTTSLLNWVSLHRAGHAVPAAAALAELEAANRDHLDPGVPHLFDRVGIALIGDDDTRLDGDGVVGVVPLLACLLVLVASRLDDGQLLHAQGVLHGREEVFFGGDVEVAFLAAGPQADGPQLAGDLRVERHDVAVEHREDGVEVHVSPVFAHDDGDDALGGTASEERLGNLLDHAPLGALAHSDEHRPLADRLHVTA